MQKKEKEKKYVATRGNENAFEGKECSSNSGSLNNMGQVAEVPSLYLVFKKYIYIYIIIIIIIKINK